MCLLRRLFGGGGGCVCDSAHSEDEEKGVATMVKVVPWDSERPGQ